MIYNHYVIHHTKLGPYNFPEELQPSICLRGDDEVFCPELVFLTTNEYWEPSLQVNENLAASDPEELSMSPGISCFKHQVKITQEAKLHYHHPRWLKMLAEAVALGSDLSEWMWVEYPCPVIKSYIYSDGWRQT